VSAVLEPTTPATRAVAEVVAGYLAAMREAMGGVVEDADTERLHDFRVAVRRTRSALKLSRPVLDPATVRRHEADGKRLGDLTTPLRDLDVHLLALAAMRERLVAADAADLAPLEARLAARRRAAYRALVRALGTKRAQGFCADWSPGLVTTADDGSGTSAAQLSRRSIRRAHRRVVKAGSSVTADSPAEDLHRLRKRCKELRYAVEMFSPLHDPATTGKAVKDLKGLQDSLGRFQDAEVQQKAVREIAEEMTRARPVEASTLLAMGEVMTHLAADQAAARAQLTDRFARLVRPKSTRRFGALAALPHTDQAAS
jgi:CHAD domain-containing protein